MVCREHLLHMLASAGSTKEHSMRSKTGDKCTAAGTYDWDGYVDGSSTPAPTTDEKAIPMQVGGTFPPVRSCNKAAWWRSR